MNGVKTGLLVLVGALLIALFSTVILKGDDAETPPAPLYFKAGSSYSNDWYKVGQLSKKDKTASARDLVDQIYEKAKAENNAPQMIKCLLHMSRLIDRMEEEPRFKIAERLKAELKTASFPLKPVLHSILGDHYFSYFQRNRWQLANRTESTIKGEDLRTWDAKTIVAASVEQYLKSLENEDSLKRMPIGYFEDVLVEQEDSRKLRPTLFDFVAHRALDVFMNSQSDLPKPTYSFELQGKAFFAPLEAFASLPLTSKDSLSFKFRGLKLLQSLLNFHLKDEDPTALYDVELKRLAYVRMHAVHPLKDSLYLAALEQFFERAGKHPYAAEIGFVLASYHSARGIQDEDQGRTGAQSVAKVKAWEICANIIRDFTGTPGANNCKVLKKTLEQEYLNLSVEAVNMPAQPFRTLVNYRNLDQIYCRVVRLTSSQKLLFEGEERREQKNGLLYLRKLPAVKEWEQALPLPKDYQLHAAEIRIPDLDKGQYAIMLSTTKDFSGVNGTSVVALTQVSALSYLNWKDNQDQSIEFHVKNRASGMPEAGVKVRLMEEDYDYNSRDFTYMEMMSLSTDVNGMASLPTPPQDYRSFKLILSKGGDTLFTQGSLYQSRPSPNTPEYRRKVNFFLDRAIYRPGQTVYFKGILMKEIEGKHSIISGENLRVRLYDANYQEIATLNVRTNEYGTFNGTFTAPTGGLTGRMSIQTDYGQASFNVEEYKRPKFEVEFEPVTGSFRPNEQVSVEGKAVAYAGSNVSGATVAYRVVRRAFWPFWGRYSWSGSSPNSNEQEIVFGVTETDMDGKFTVEFEAIPDFSLSAKDKPVFIYEVKADVTDLNGETRSSQTTVKVGYVDLVLDLDLPDILAVSDRNRFGLTTNNQNGQPVPASGTITVHRLKQPGRILRSRYWATPDQFTMQRAAYEKDFPHDIYDQEVVPEFWEKEEEVFRKDFETEGSDSLTFSGLKGWQPGKYMLEIRSKDKFGSPVSIKRYLTVFDEKGGAMPLKEAFWFHPLQTQAEPGDSVGFMLGTGAEALDVLLKVELNGKLIRNERISLKNECRQFRIGVKEAYRGNFQYSLAAVINGRVETRIQQILVPWSNKQLNLEYGTFRDKLRPGQPETWRMKISGPKGEAVAAELLTSMYDASLDAFGANTYWDLSVNPTWPTSMYFSPGDGFGQLNGQVWETRDPVGQYDFRKYERLDLFGYRLINRIGLDRMIGIAGQTGADYYTYTWSNQSFRGGGDLSGTFKLSVMDANATTTSEAPPPVEKEAALEGEFQNILPDYPKSMNGEDQDKSNADYRGGEGRKSTGLSGVKVRTNLNETAFFYPDLKTDANGAVIVSFTMPEALTRWKVRSLAHTKDLKTGYLEKTVITQKDLMVLPNPPRFFRENDRIVFSSKISNLAKRDLSGSASLEIRDALTGKRVEAEFGLRNAVQSFQAKKGQSTVVEWELQIPEGIQAVTWTVKAKSGVFTDGEQQALPVLTNRMLVTEAMPLPLRPRQTKTFTFDRLINNSSSTLRHHKLTLEFTSNPAWYAIQSLPYLMEYPYECTEQTFSRYYANSIAAHVANSSPRIKQVFDAWKSQGKEALLSNLDKNEELKYLLLEETPWVLQSQDESERKKRVGLLFDLNRMGNELKRAQNKIRMAQVGNGGFSWFPGMPDSRYITQHIVTGFGHLDRMGVKEASKDPDIIRMMKKAIGYLDQRIREDYEALKRNQADMDKDQLRNLQIQYLYARSFFKTETVDLSSKKAFDYFLDQALRYWPEKGRYQQGMLALALHRFGKQTEAKAIVAALKDNALQDEEMGMYWKLENGWYWYQAPIETQALLIEAFTEVTQDLASVEEMKLWLLKQKQTQDWKTTKATTEACYALLLQGTDYLAESKLARITIGGRELEPGKMEQVSVEAGTGYFKTAWMGKAITREMGNVKVVNRNEVAAWGAVYWQYFEQLDKITSQANNIGIEKELFRQVNSPSGPKLEPVTANLNLKPGDLCKVRLKITVDRDMEYVHIKDMRGAGFEPVNVLSRYKYQGGLGYYESTRDAATNFFISWLPKGTYMFEYPLRVQHRGEFSMGITTIQCMYAPEFTAHSEGIRVNISESN